MQSNKMSASCSMRTFHGLCKSFGIDLETFLSSLGAGHERTYEDVATIKKLRKALDEQFDQMHNRGNVLNSEYGYSGEDGGGHGRLLEVMFEVVG